MKTKTYKRATIYIDGETLKRLKIYCVKKEISISGCVLGWIDFHLKEEKKS